jgi:site-specific DNA recombinase
MTRVCLYTRISTDEENQPTSLASQRERLQAFCKVQEDWRMIAHHEDRATGTKLERPGLQAALDLAREGKIRPAARLQDRPPVPQGAPALQHRRGA